MTQHPKAVEAQQRASLEAARRKEVVQKEVDLANEHGLKFVHIRATDVIGDVQANGGATVAYQFAGTSRINVSVATCHKVDFYSKPAGRLKAAENFAAGHYITLRIPKNVKAGQFLKTTFFLSGQISL